MILTPNIKGEAFLMMAREINRANPTARISRSDFNRLKPDPIQYAVGCVEWQAEQDALAAAALAAAQPPPSPPAATDVEPPSTEGPTRRMPTFFVSARSKDRI